MREVADAIVEVMNVNGVRELFVMPGDAFPIIEAVVHRNEVGEAAPRLVSCPHEATALSAAHGHYLVSAAPQACLFHVDVGLQTAGGMLHNAQRGRAGVVILGGRTPITFDGSMRGGRVIDLHWQQDRFDLASVVRDYVKWYADVSRGEPLAQTLQRAFQLAAAAPAGPVYVSLLRELLLEPLSAFEPLPPARFAPPAPPAADAAALGEAARLLAASERPVAVAGYVGRTAAGFDALTAFADALALPVVVRPERANLSSESPCNIGSDDARLADADVVLLLDVDVPYIPAFTRLAPDAVVVQIDIDPLKTGLPVWGFPVDVAMTADTAVALPDLTALVEERLDDSSRRRRERRREGLVAAQSARREARAHAAAAGGGISAAYLSHCVAALVDDGTIVVDDSTTAKSVASEHIPMRQPGSYFQPGGSSMGWGAGAALGVKLAAPEQTVIGLNAEGNFLSGAPESALLTSVRYGAPTLTVLYNNAEYAAIRYGMLHEYGEGSTARGGFEPLSLEPPAFEAIARACGCHGERVAERDELPAALARALDAVHGGQPAVVDARVTA